MSPAVTTLVINDQASKLKKKSHLMQPQQRKEWDGRCSNSFTDNDEAIDMAAGDTTPKLIRHTLYTHSTSHQDIFSLRYTYVLEVYSEATTYFKPFTGTVIK